MGIPTPMSPVFDVTPAALTQSAESLVDRIGNNVTRLVESVSLDNAIFENVIRPLADIDNDVSSCVQYTALFQAVSPSSALREASSAAVSAIEKAYLTVFQHEGLFALVDAVHENPSRQKHADEEDKRLLDRFHKIFVDNGIKLVGSDRTRFVWISRRLIDLRVAFMENLSKDPGCIWKAEHELPGVSLDALERGEDDSQCRIPLTKPGITSVLNNCRDANTRAEIFIGGQSIYPENVEVFRELVVLRDEAARLLGFSSFAAQQARQKLLNSPDKVKGLLDELILALQPMAGQEIRALKEYHSGPLRLSDFDFYHNQILREKYHIDHELVAEYFPAQVTVRRMLDTFETLFALEITELDGVSENCKWHDDVRAFEVWEADRSAFIGYLYIDLYPRPGKYSHAANFNIYPSYIDSDGKRTAAATALVCNVSRTSIDKPSLLRHREVITIFHELGHGMHDLLGKSKYAMFHGHRVVHDFVEAPSQLLEYWCWVPECLQRLSCHYSYLSDEYCQHWLTTNGKDAIQPSMEIPTQLVDKIAAAKQLNQGILTLRQVAFSRFDMIIHNPASHAELQATDMSTLYKSLLQDMTYLKGPENGLDWGHGHATTSHYIWGQESNYYSYLYTRILAAEIWFSNFHPDPMSQEAGLRYRQMVLNYGGSRDEWEMLMSFLGRDPTPKAYLRDIGASV